MTFLRFRGLSALAVMATVLLSTAGRADAQLDKMFSRVPSDANAIIAVDLDDLEGSELGKENKWAQQRAMRQAPGVYSPNVRRVLTGASVKPMHLESKWELTLLEAKIAPNMEALAVKLGSHVDQIDGTPIIETRGDSYVALLADKLVGVLHPAGRQDVASWLRSKTPTGQSDYLRAAVKRITDRTPIVAAIDLRDMTTEANVRVALEGHEAFENQAGKLDEIAPILASIQGLSFDVQVSKNAAATLRLDFEKPAGPLKDYKDLMIDVLADMGISVPEFRDWNASASGNTFLLQGKLTNQSIDRLLAIADTRFQAKLMGDSSEYAGSAAEKEGNESARLALSYYRDVEDIIAKVGDYSGANATMYARWFRRQADALENLPTLGVDPELVDFALNVAKGLRETAATLRGTASRKVMQQTSVNLSRGGSYGEFYGSTAYGGYGYYRGGGLYNPNAEAAGRARRGTQKRMISVEQRSKAADATFSTMDAIAEELAKLRIQMTEKYEVQF